MSKILKGLLTLTVATGITACENSGSMRKRLEQVNQQERAIRTEVSHLFDLMHASPYGPNYYGPHYQRYTHEIDSLNDINVALASEKLELENKLDPHDINWFQTELAKDRATEKSLEPKYHQLRDSAEHSPDSNRYKIDLQHVTTTMDSLAGVMGSLWERRQYLENGGPITNPNPTRSHPHEEKKQAPENTGSLFSRIDQINDEKTSVLAQIDKEPTSTSLHNQLWALDSEQIMIAHKVCDLKADSIKQEVVKVAYKEDAVEEKLASAILDSQVTTTSSFVQWTNPSDHSAAKPHTLRYEFNRLGSQRAAMTQEMEDYQDQHTSLEFRYKIKSLKDRQIVH